MSEPVHHDSHAPLLARLRPGRLPLGGIVTPATRDAESVLNSVVLGAQLDVPVVLLCSKQARPKEIAQRAALVRGAACAVIDLTRPFRRDRLPRLRTDRISQATFGAYGDLSLKRNLGLLLARLADWPTLLFLDDDISGLSATQVRRAVGALEHHTAAGMPATDFPDNSVVCHARRFAGAQQDVFVSGSALAVNVQAAESFFPQVYNEDWLFLAPHLDRREVVAHGKVRQAYFNPFDSPRRAMRQEFGDVLAEGLVGHLHGGTLDEAPSIGYWQAFLDSRSELIAVAVEAYRRQARYNPVARDALCSLRRAESTRIALRPGDLAQYVKAWLADLEVWRRHLTKVPALGTVEGALEFVSCSALAVNVQRAESFLPQIYNEDGLFLAPHLPR